ncbi:MAG: hypothetical protein Tsb005_15720 [Gammaproteobacteria bacterium]
MPRKKLTTMDPNLVKKFHKITDYFSPPSANNTTIASPTSVPTTTPSPMPPQQNNSTFNIITTLTTQSQNSPQTSIIVDLASITSDDNTQPSDTEMNTDSMQFSDAEDFETESQMDSENSPYLVDEETQGNVRLLENSPFNVTDLNLSDDEESFQNTKNTDANYKRLKKANSITYFNPSKASIALVQKNTDNNTNNNSYTYQPPQKKDWWYQQAELVLKEYSEGDGDFKTLKQEWAFTGNVQLLYPDASDCELCGYKGIVYEFEIRNMHNNNQLMIGSQCIYQFAAYNPQFPNQNIILNPEESYEYIKAHHEEALKENNAIRKAGRQFIKF